VAEATALPLVRARPAARRRRFTWLRPWLLLAPSLLLLAAFTYWPLCDVVWRSFVVHEFGTPAHWGLGNYAALLADAQFARAGLNNAIYAAGTILPSLGLALGFALALRDSRPFLVLLRTLVALPLLIPLVAAAALFTFVYLPGEGLLDHYLAPFGLGAVNWLGDPSLALGAVIAITVWKNTGYYMLFFLAGLAGVPQELLDAARIDGAGAWARFRHVTLPLLGPTFGFVLPIALINALTQVDHVVVMTQGGPSDATTLLLYYIYEQAEQNHANGLASAATVVSLVVLLALSLASLRTIDARMHHEA
jgi:sn-glycerol 3-phosphate transport system permease protein